jgi:hypothetical protein
MIVVSDASPLINLFVFGSLAELGIKEKLLDS